MGFLCASCVSLHVLYACSDQNGGGVVVFRVQDKVMDGEGTLRGVDGTTYTGQLVNGKPEGEGRWISPSGSNYEGTWKAGKANGKGRLVHPDGSS